MDSMGEDSPGWLCVFACLQVNEALPHMDAESLSASEVPVAMPNMPEGGPPEHAGGGHALLRSKGAVPSTAADSSHLSSHSSLDGCSRRSQWLRYGDAMPAPELLPISPALRAGTASGPPSAGQWGHAHSGPRPPAAPAAGWNGGVRDVQVDLRVSG